ncbi:hypothetical protein MMC29_004869 [Sticta canariensis]|nr:hypothetical protein [Sticta canariensis]
MGLPSDSVSGHRSQSSASSTSKTPETGPAMLKNASLNFAVPPVPRNVSLHNPSDVFPEKITASSSVPAKRKRDSDNAEPVSPEKPFASQIFNIYVGTERTHFTAHEVFLARSPRLKALCVTKKGKYKGATNLKFPFEHPNSFSHLLEYLYLNVIAIPTGESIVEARQLADLFSVARRFQLHEMQKDVISRLDDSQISSRIPAMDFFSLAEDLFSEGMVDSLQRYFIKVAPPLINALNDEHLPKLERMVADGGEFAQALFAAYRETFHLKTVEESKEKLSTSSDTEVGTRVKIEMQPETKIEQGTNKLKVSSPSWDSLSEKDKMLVNLRSETSNWNQISQAWHKATGTKVSIKGLLARYTHITAGWRPLKDGDVRNPNFTSPQFHFRFSLTPIYYKKPFPTNVGLERASHSGRSASQSQVRRRNLADDRQRDGGEGRRSLSAVLPAEHVLPDSGGPRKQPVIQRAESGGRVAELRTGGSS